MTIALTSLAAAGVLALLVLVGLQLADRRRGRSLLERRLRRTLLVHRVGLPSVRGVLVEEVPDGLVLRRAEYLLEAEHRGEPAPDPVALDGDTLVRWDAVDCVQDLSATARTSRARPAPARAGQGSPISARFASAPADPRPMKAA